MKGDIDTMSVSHGSGHHSRVTVNRYACPGSTTAVTAGGLNLVTR
ncbi:hypothetical protein [Alloactinosynnema sp. L-07]|nr:hypothetical protein [Alloactinosynnema sp. L-07]